MALPELIPFHSSSSSLTHKPSINPKNATNPPLLSPNFNPFSTSSSVSISQSQSRRFHNLTSLRCSASSSPEKHRRNIPKSDNAVIQLPLFPLPLVLFPGSVLPLKIFEFRYRIMIQTLLHTDLRFGIIYTDAVSRTSDVVCVGEIVKNERLVEDRFFLICKDQEWFRVTDVVRINGKAGKEAKDLRKKMFPTPFSFFVESTFEGAPREQQALLEMEDTAARLKREKKTLRNTLNYLSAAPAWKDVFPSS